MREYFDKELTQLNDSLIEMGGLVEQAIKNTMKMIVVYIKDKKQVFNLTHILEMGDNASKMVTEAIDAFVKSDIEVAKKVARQDDIVDELFNRSKNETVELIHKNKELGSEALDIVMIAKYLERIADHAVNVAEWVAFSITGSCDLSD